MNSDKIYDELLEFLNKNLLILPDKPDETPRKTLDTLLDYSCNCKRSQNGKYYCPLPELREESFCRLKDLVQKERKEFL